MTGGEYIVDAMIRMGIEYVIGIPGHGCLAVFDALRERVAKGEIRYIQARQEMSAVHLADGYYRASGRPAAVLTSIGAGAVNAALGIATSYVDSTPVLVLTGDAHTHMRGVGLLQEIERQQDSDYVSVMRPITKRAWRVDTADQLPRIMERALHEMMSGRRGPVLVSLPMDIQAAEVKASPYVVSSPSALTEPSVPECALKQAAEMLREAKRPVIVAGGGAYYARASEELVAFAERTGAPVVTTMASKSVFPEGHRLYGFHGGSKGTEVGNYLTRTADLVIALGCRFADESTSSYRTGITYNFPDSKLIHVDIDPSEIGKNYRADLGIVGDVRMFLKGMLALLGEGADHADDEYAKDIARAKAEWRAKVEAGAMAPRTPVTISRMLREMENTLPDQAVVVCSSGNSQAQILQEYVFPKPYTFITSGGMSTMGFSLPAAIGAKLARPDAPVVAVVGDGDFLMTMQEMCVAVQYNIPVVVVVVNNMAWMAIKDLQMDVYGEKAAFGNDFTDAEGRLYTPDFALAAKAFGMDAVQVDAPDTFREALKEALESGRPHLIDVRVNREYPYSGGAATGWWDVPVPTHMEKERSRYENGMSEETI